MIFVRRMKHDIEKSLKLHKIKIRVLIKLLINKYQYTLYTFFL